MHPAHLGPQELALGTPRARRRRDGLRAPLQRPRHPRQGPPVVRQRRAPGYAGVRVGVVPLVLLPAAADALGSLRPQRRPHLTLGDRVREPGAEPQGRRHRRVRSGDGDHLVVVEERERGPVAHVARPEGVSGHLQQARPLAGQGGPRGAERGGRSVRARHSPAPLPPHRAAGELRGRVERRLVAERHPARRARLRVDGPRRPHEARQVAHAPVDLGLRHARQDVAQKAVDALLGRLVGVEHVVARPVAEPRRYRAAVAPVQVRSATAQHDLGRRRERLGRGVHDEAQHVVREVRQVRRVRGVQVHVRAHARDLAAPARRPPPSGEPVGGEVRVAAAEGRDVHVRELVGAQELLFEAAARAHPRQAPPRAVVRAGQHGDVLLPLPLRRM